MPPVKVIEQKISRSAYTRRLQVEKKHCVQCGKVFEGVKKSRFCSPACRSKHSYNANAEKRRAARMERYRQQKQQATGTSAR